MHRPHLRKLTLAFAWILAFFTAQAQNAPLKKLYINPKAAKAEQQSVFVDSASVSFFPLEYSKEADNGSYYYIVTTEPYIVLNSWNDRCFYVYTKDGRFIKVISYKKYGKWGSPTYNPLEKEITFFAVNPKYSLTVRDNIQIELDFQNPKNAKYYSKTVLDLKDSSLELKPVKVTAFDIRRINHLFKNYFLENKIQVNKLYKDSVDYEIKIYQDKKVVHEYFPYDKQKDPRYQYFSFYTQVQPVAGSEDCFWVCRPFVDTIYSLHDFKITPAYKVILPMENALPKFFGDSIFKDKTDYEGFQANNAWLFRQFYPIYENERYFFFNIEFLQQFGQYVYDKKLGTTYDIRKIKGDSTNYFMNLVQSGDYDDKTKKMRAFLRPGQMMEIYQKYKDSNIPLPEKLKACFTPDFKHASPTIVEFTIKSK